MYLFPTKNTLVVNTINNGNLMGFPGLIAKAGQKYLPGTVAKIKGHPSNAKKRTINKSTN